MAGGFLDAMFGRILDDGVEKELRGALNFAGFSIEPYDDPATGRPAGWTVRASAQGIEGSGTYLHELAKWDGSAWVPADDGRVSARIIGPVSGDTSEQAGFVGDSGYPFSGLTRFDNTGDGLTYVRAALRGDKPADAPDEMSGEAQVNAVDEDGTEVLGFRVAFKVFGDSPAGIRHGFYGHDPEPKPAVSVAGTAGDQVAALRTALVGLGLISTV